MSDRTRASDVDPDLEQVLASAYAERVDVEVAARHLWAIHRAAGSLPNRRAGVARTRRVLVSVVAGSMLFMSSGGALAASGSALPGDVLYPVKRGVEKARIVLTVSSEGDARIHLDLARRRMAEARAAADRRPAVVATLVREALDSLEVARRSGDTAVALAAVDTRREAEQEMDQLLAAIDQEVVDTLRQSRKRGDSGTMTPAGEAAAEEPAASGSPEASAEPSPEDSPSASASPTPEPSPSESAGASPSQSPSPSESAGPTPSSSPSADPSASPSTSPSASPSQSEQPSEPSPSTSPTRRYESVDEPTPQTEGTPAPTPSS